jgi:PAS domain S-box-containing protein
VAEKPVSESAVISALGGEPHLGPGEILGASPGLQLVYDTAPVGLAFLSTDCRYLMINQHLTEICGISVADHLGKTVREMVPQVAEQVEQIVRHVVASGEPITGIEVNGQRPDRSNVDRVWITYWHPLKNPHGNVIGVNVAAEEITERKRAEAERVAMQNRLQQLNESLAERVEAQAEERERLWRLSLDLLLVPDVTGTILNVNPAWRATLGWTAEELVGKPWVWLLHPDDLDRSLVELANLQAGRPSPHSENRMRCKDGSYRWLSWRAMADRSSVYAIARDITDLKKSEDQFHSMRSELAQVARHETVGAMTASIAHELKQPLGAIAANAGAGLRWLKRADPNLAEAEAALHRIMRDSERVDEVITSIRAMFGRKPSERHSVDMRSLTDEALALTQRELEAHRIVPRNNVGSDLPPVLADRVQLQQVLINLIMNGIEAMSAVDNRERLLTIVSSTDGSEITITVADTGIGIEPEKLDRLFEPFFTTKRDGMGLGLSISRSIVEVHGGRLRASPQRPFGTAFHMTLLPAEKGSPNRKPMSDRGN